MLRRNAENAVLFYDIQNENLTMYDVTSESASLRMKIFLSHPFGMSYRSDATCIMHTGLTQSELDPPPA